MKRYAIAAVAALVAAGPLSAASASAQDFRGSHDGRNDNDQGRDRDRNDRDGRRDNDRRANRWDQRQHNGFYMGGRFHYGQPTYAQMQRRDYRPAWQQWRRGDRLPPFARTQYREVDWRRAHYRAPPRGYRYVRDDRGEVLLVGVATGVILSILLAN